MRIAGIMAICLLLAMSTVAMAKNASPSNVETRIEGLITSIDAVAQTLVVDGTTVQVTTDTVIQMRGNAITFEQLAIDMTVAVCGVLDGDVLNANRVTVKYGGA